MSKSVVVILPLIVLSIGTSLLAAYKIIKTTPGTGQTAVISEVTGEPTVGERPSAALRPVIPGQAGATTRPIGNNNPTAGAVSTQNSQTADNRCLVTLAGQIYDVTPLKTDHPGGDIFVCGTDMTTVYQGQHGSDLSRMAPYLASGNTVNNQSNPAGQTGVNQNANGQGGNNNQREREREDEDD